MFVNDAMDNSMNNKLYNNIYLYIFLTLMVIEVTFLSYYGISRHFNYLTSINDLGHMDQAIWGTLNGEPFLNSDIFNKPFNRLGGHFDPVLALFVPFYLIAPSVVWLILAQAIAIPLAGLPIYYLAKRVVQSERIALFWAAACMLSPFMLSAASWDFHPVSLAAPFIALAFLAVEKKQPWLLFATCLFILLCKEHFGLLVSGFGLLWYIRHRDWKTSAFFILSGLGFFLLVMKVIIPTFSPSGGHLMLSEDMGAASRYSWLGNSLEEIARTILTKPVETLHQIFSIMGGWKYLVLLLVPLLCLPLLGCEFLLPGLADLLVNLLSANPMPRSVFSYHSVTLIPVFIAAAIYGSRRAVRLLKTAVPERLAIVALIITVVIGWITFPFFSLPGGLGLWEPKRVLGFHDPNYAMVQDLITPDMSVSVQANIGAHFTQRHEVYMYPNKVGEVDAVILHLDSPTLLTDRRNPHEIGSLGHHLQMDSLDYLNSVQSLLVSNKYSIFVRRGSWLIFMRGEMPNNNHADLIDEIDRLKTEWGIKY